MVTKPEEFAHDVYVDGEGLDKAKIRYEAIQAVKAGTATPAQRELVFDTDRVMQEAMKMRRS